MSDKSLNIPLLNLNDIIQSSSKKCIIDNITGSTINTDIVKLNPYQVMWLSLLD